MNVQTTFQGKVLKKGEEYDVQKKFAKRWSERRLAVITDTNQEDDDQRLEELNITPSGSGWYELPNGEKIQGKDKAIEAAEELIKETAEENDGGEEVTDDESQDEH